MSTNLTMAPAQWAQMEFALAQLGDQRRTQRLVKIATGLAQSPGGTLPQAMPQWDELKAAYRFFSQPKNSYRTDFAVALGAHPSGVSRTRRVSAP
jgi:hypothetical protein